MRARAEQALRLRLHERGDHYVIASWRSLFVMIWYGGASLHALDAMERHEDRVLARHPDGITSFFVIRDIEITKPPGADVRERSAQLLEKYAPRLRGTAQVIEGGGFKASMARTFLTAVTLFGRSKVKTKAFGDTRQAMRWVGALPAQEAGVGERAEALCAAIDALRL